MSFFKDEDMKKATVEVAEWKSKFPEAANELKEIWKRNIMTAGHKTMAREIVKEQQVKK